MMMLIKQYRSVSNDASFYEDISRFRDALRDALDAPCALTIVDMKSGSAVTIPEDID